MSGDLYYLPAFGWIKVAEGSDENLVVEVFEGQQMECFKAINLDVISCISIWFETTEDKRDVVAEVLTEDGGIGRITLRDMSSTSIEEIVSDVVEYMRENWRTPQCEVYDTSEYFVETLKEAYLGDVDSQFELAMEFVRSGIEHAAWHWFEVASRNGHSDASAALASLYYNGLLSVEQDPAKAFEFAKAGTEQGSAEAKAVLAQCYLYGFGVEKDTDKFCALIQEAIKEGAENSGYEILACAYESGELGVVDTEKAYEYRLKVNYYDCFPIWAIEEEYCTDYSMQMNDYYEGIMQEKEE